MITNLLIIFKIKNKIDVHKIFILRKLVINKNENLMVKAMDCQWQIIKKIKLIII